jgi:RimJ/RimL family protein N-acetyltransferase
MGQVLHTARLDLVLLEPEGARALTNGVEDNGHPWASGYPLASTLLRAEMTLAAAAHNRPLGPFGTYQVIRRTDGQVIGDVGFMGPPDATGAVHVGCAITEEARR